MITPIWGVVLYLLFFVGLVYSFINMTFGIFFVVFLVLVGASITYYGLKLLQAVEATA